MNSEKETKYEKFVRLGDVRLKRVLEDLRKLGNLSNRQNYDFDEVAVDYLLHQISKETTILKQKFNVNKDVDEEYTLSAYVAQSHNKYKRKSKRAIEV